MTDINDISTRIKLIREKLHLLQKDFANELGISAPSLSEIETGRNKPGLELIVKLADKFNVNFYYLLSGKGEMFADPVMDYFLRAPEFAVNTEDVREFLEIFSRSKEIQYHTISEFKSRMMREGDLILKRIGLNKSHKSK